MVITEIMASLQPSRPQSQSEIYPQCRILQCHNARKAVRFRYDLVLEKEPRSNMHLGKGRRKREIISEIWKPRSRQRREGKTISDASTNRSRFFAEFYPRHLSQTYLQRASVT